MPPSADIDQISHAELKSLFVALWEQNVELQRTVAALRDEVARLKGGPGRPNIKPEWNGEPSRSSRETPASRNSAEATRARRLRSTRSERSKQRRRHMGLVSKATRAM